MNTIHLNNIPTILMLLIASVLMILYVLVYLYGSRYKITLEWLQKALKSILLTLEGYIMSTIRFYYLRIKNWFRMNRLMNGYKLYSWSGVSSKVLNHWGIWIDNINPVTGVIGFNECSEWIWDEESIDIDFESHLNDPLEHNELNCEICEYWDSSETTELIGGWILDTNTQLYEPDPDSEYSAIVNGSMFTIQVVRSQTLLMGNPCSPCYPGQVEFSQSGDFIAYSLPYDLIQPELVPFNKLTYKWYIKSRLQDLYTYQIWNRYCAIRFRFKYYIWYRIRARFDSTYKFW